MKKRFYVVSDIHSFYSEFMESLTDSGFFSDPNSKLIVLGDILDRGRESKELEKFISNLIDENRVILIRGNHEDLLLNCIDNLEEELSSARIFFSHHCRNGTIQSIGDLLGVDVVDLIIMDHSLTRERIENTSFLKKIIPKMKDYFETENYIFVHGWIPCDEVEKKEYVYKNDWRNGTPKEFENSRWINGMLAWAQGVEEKGKTIVCGHWHASFGHSALEGKGSEFGADADFSPFYGDGIIAIDGCTAYSGKVNIVIIEDEEGEL